MASAGEISPKLLDLKRQWDAAKAAYGIVDARYLEACAREEAMMQPFEHLRESDWYAHSAAFERACEESGYTEANDEWEGALEDADELSREIMAEPTTTHAEYALKLSVAQDILDRHYDLADDMDDQSGWMERVLARLFSDANRLLGVAIA